LYRFILDNAEEIDGQLVCRASLIAELRRRGVEFPGRVRKKLVKELTERGLVLRPHPRSTWLVVLDPNPSIPKTSRKRFIDRMSFGDEPDAIEILAFPSRRYGCDRQATEVRLARLKEYMHANVLAGKRFVCSSWRECKTPWPPDAPSRRAISPTSGSTTIFLAMASRSGSWSSGKRSVPKAKLGLPSPSGTPTSTTAAA
jgi:hypothetical protein